METELDMFYSFWQQVLPTYERAEFVESFSNWNCSINENILPTPKSLGFVVLSPVISLTPAGLELVNSRWKDEFFLRQLLKFQVPSPFHKPSPNSADFWGKTYLELLRLVCHFGSLKFDEVMIFGLELVDYREFDTIVEKNN